MQAVVEQKPVSYKFPYHRIIIFLLILIWCLGFSYASIFPRSSLIVIYPILKQMYSVVCHQTAYKSFHFNGFQFLVCARCTGIYFGALLASFTFLFTDLLIFKNTKIIFAAAVPMLVDVIFYSTGLYKYSKPIAFGSGFIFGSIVIVFIFIIVENFIQKKNQNK